jgi:UDP-glucose 4-epimerase
MEPMSTIMVTGASGLIGRHLIRRLLDKGFKVIGCSRTNVNDGGILNHPKYNFKECDVSLKESVRKLFNEKIDVVVHLAGHMDSSEDFEEYKKLINVNTIGTMNLVEEVRKSACKKLIYSSSVSVIGIPEYLPVDEGHACRPRNLYGLSKRFSEELITFFSDKYNIKSLIFRLPSIFSEKGESGAVFAFIQNAIRNKELNIDLRKIIVWNIIHIDDVISALLVGIEKIDKIERHEIFNIGYNDECEIENIAKNIIKLANSRSTIKKRGTAKSYPFLFDCKKAREFLGLEMPSLNERLTQMVENSRKIGSRND